MGDIEINQGSQFKLWAARAIANVSYTPHAFVACHDKSYTTCPAAHPEDQAHWKL